MTILISVKKEVPKVRKFEYSFSSPFGIISANRYISRMEKIMLISKMKPPMLTMAGTLNMKVIIVFLRALLLLKKKNMHIILKDLIAGSFNIIILLVF